MKIEFDFPDTLVEKIVRGIMDNFPEASSGNALRCSGWNYGECLFVFVDDEENKEYKLGRLELMSAFSLMFTDKWPKGCTKLPMSVKWEDWEEWLGQADATDFDAFVQLAALGEVIYG